MVNKNDNDISDIKAEKTGDLKRDNQTKDLKIEVQGNSIVIGTARRKELRNY